MAAHASMRAGAGYVTACVPGSVQAIVAGSSTPELMTRGLRDTDGGLDADGVAEVLDLATRGALALGPGLGRSAQTVAFARALARKAELPLVLDADGLNAHAGQLAGLAQRRAETVLTPHAGELARLLETDSAIIERERLRHARASAERSQAVVVLKGDDTLVADPTGRVAVSRGGAHGLATAGTGDVLTGVIGTMLAQGLDAFAAAAAGVWLHVQAGKEAARRLGGPDGVIATDVIAALPAVRAAASHRAQLRLGARAARDGADRGEGHGEQ
jgi:NAD(P)H-hydrate epimerase